MMDLNKVSIRRVINPIVYLVFAIHMSEARFRSGGEGPSCYLAATTPVHISPKDRSYRPYL